MRSTRTLLIGIFVFSLLMPVMQAAQITWTTSTVSGPSDVSTAGRLMGALEVGQNTPQTISGVTFAADPGGTAAIPLGPAVSVIFPSANAGNPNFWAQADPGGSAAYGTALDTARWNDSALSEALTLTGLTPGRVYLVQLWIVDTRSGTATRTRTVRGDETTATSTTSGGPNIATGTFIATASTQAITITGVDFVHGTQLNLLQVRDITGGFTAPPMDG